MPRTLPPSDAPTWAAIRARLDEPRVQPLPPANNLASSWYAPPEDPDWPTPESFDDAEALLARLGDEQADVCIRAGMAELMRAEQTDACIVAAVGNSKIYRLMQQLTDLARRYEAACSRTDFLPRWWRRCRCRLAIADVADCELEVPDHSR